MNFSGAAPFPPNPYSDDPFLDLPLDCSTEDARFWIEVQHPKERRGRGSVWPERVKRRLVAEMSLGKRSWQNIAAKFQLSKRTLSLWAAEAGLEVEVVLDKTRAMRSASQVYDHERRLEVVDEAIDRVREMIANRELSPHQLQALMISLGIAVDKRLLLEQLDPKTAQVGRPGQRLEALQAGRDRLKLIRPTG